VLLRQAVIRWRRARRSSKPAGPVDLGHGAKPWLIVSNNARNRNLETVFAVRLTTTSKHANLPLSPADPLTGYIVVDDLIHALPRPTHGGARRRVSPDDARGERRYSHRPAVTPAVRPRRSLIHGRHTTATPASIPPPDPGGCQMPPGERQWTTSNC